MYYVYLIQSEKDKSFYVGQTSNINERLRRHNLGKVKSTRNKLPWKLLKTEACETRAKAMWREHFIKTRKKVKDEFISN